MIKVAICHQLIIYNSKASRLRKTTQMIKIGSCHQLMTQTWQIFTAEGLDGISEDNILTITQSTSEDSIYKSKMSRLQNPTQMINLGSCHRLIPRTWRIVMTEGLGPGRAIISILRKLHLPDSSSRDFENPNENISPLWMKIMGVV